MIDVVLLVLKLVILVLLYLFIWLVVKGAARDVVGAAQAVAPPDVALPEGALPAVAATPAERLQRREERAAERTEAGQGMDLTQHIQPRLVVETSPIVPAGVIFPLEGWITVGRAPNSDIVLDEPFVSSTHARLMPVGQFYEVEDLGSTNGTFVNEKHVTQAQLKLDTRLRIGETVFRYEE